MRPFAFCPFCSMSSSARKRSRVSPLLLAWADARADAGERHHHEGEKQIHHPAGNSEKMRQVHCVTSRSSSGPQSPISRPSPTGANGSGQWGLLRTRVEVLVWGSASSHAPWDRRPSPPVDGGLRTARAGLWSFPGWKARGLMMGWSRCEDESPCRITHGSWFKSPSHATRVQDPTPAGS